MARLGYPDPTPGPQLLTIAGTATGQSDYIQYLSGFQQFGIVAWSTGSTKCTTGNYKLQGAIGSTNVWFDLMAVDNPTTLESAATLVVTTEGLTVDRVILTTTSNSGGSTEASVLLSAWIVPLSGGGGVGTG